MIVVPARVREVTGWWRASRESLAARDVALLGARIGLAWLFIYHGAFTLFGAFGGPGLHSASLFYAHTAHLHPGIFFAALGGVIEFFGGIAIGLGVLGRLAAAALVGDMLIAMATVTFGNGIATSTATISVGGGYELNLALAALALVVAALGTGRFSLDELLRPHVLKALDSQDKTINTTPRDKPTSTTPSRPTA